MAVAPLCLGSFLTWMGRICPPDTCPKRQSREVPGWALAPQHQWQWEGARHSVREKQQKDFLKCSFQKTPLFPKMQPPKMLLHLFCTSLFTVAGLDGAPNRACCRMWRWAFLLPWPWAHTCSSGNNNTANKDNDCRAVRVYLVFSQVM